jgi:hypothetical protein
MPRTWPLGPTAAPQVGEGAAGAAAHVEGGLPGPQAHLGHGGGVRRVVVGEALFPGRRPRGEERAGLGQVDIAAEAVDHGRVDPANDRPGRVLEVDDDVGGALGVDLGEVVDCGTGGVLVPGRVGGVRSALTQEHDQVPGARELGALEEASVHQHQVVAGPGTVGGSCHTWPRRVEEAEHVQRHAAAAATAVAEHAAQVVGDGVGRGVGEAVDRDMDRWATVDGSDRVGERLDNLGAPGRTVGVGRGVHPDRPFGGLASADSEREARGTARLCLALAASAPSIARERLRAW